MRVPWPAGGDALRFDIVSCLSGFLDVGRVCESGVGVVSHGSLEVAHSTAAEAQTLPESALCSPRISL